MTDLKALCVKELGWLIDHYNFRAAESGSSAVLARVVLTNDALFVEVCLDRRERRLTLCVGLLAEDAIPRTPIGLRDGELVRTCVTVGSIMALRTGNWAAAAALEDVASQDDVDVERALRGQSVALREHAMAVFAGDPGLITEVDEMLRRRVEESLR